MNIKFKNDKTKVFFEKEIIKISENKKELLWSYDKRQQERKKFKFAETNNLWNDKHFNISDNIGQICELTSKFENSGCDMTFEEWEKFYLNNGRDFMQIYNISSDFYKACEEEKIDITEEEALNYCYIRIIDEAYIGMKREYYTLLSLQKRFPDINFEFVSKGDDVVYGIDIAIYRDNNIINGFQIKSPNAIKRKRVIKENNVRFKKCMDNYGFCPIYLISEENGEILYLAFHKDGKINKLKDEDIDSCIRKMAGLS